MGDPAAMVAGEILRAFHRYRADFSAVTRRARERFLARDWHGGRADSVERLELLASAIAPAVAAVRARFGPRERDRMLWKETKSAYARLLPAHAEAELAETFYNSVTRRILGTVGVDVEVEFTLEGLGNAPLAEDSGLLVLERGATAPALARLLARHFGEGAFADLAGDAALAARRLEDRLGGPPDAIEAAVPLFYRNKGAYLVGRLRKGETALPLVLALLNTEGKVVVDAVLTEEDEASIVFSFTQAYFHVDVANAAGLVAFLKAIMPKKPVAELYAAVGFHKHAKTEAYRYLFRHLAATEDLFEEAPGERGLVMVAFALPSYDVIFKVLRDRFGPTKQMSRDDVKAKYDLVFRHGRAGRLLDVQEFTGLELPKSRFSDALLELLDREAKESVRIGRDRVVLDAWAERRLVPLNVFLGRTDPEAGRRAAVDYGEALRELAATNIFPGDLLVKNFGVTRHGRVVFYDYDEVSFLLDVNFRPLPEGEPGSFWVGEADVFPEELLPFLGLPREAREAFVAAHADLLAPRFWLETQKRIRAGELFDVYPYPPARRLRTPAGPDASGPVDSGREAP